MIITFCGHGDFQETEAYKNRVLAFLEETVGKEPVDMYLGGYGGFDSFAYGCCRQFKETHPAASLVFVTPYMHGEQREMGYDSILFPALEHVPSKFAISARNKYMMEKADWVIAYVSHTWGGAYAAYKHALKKGKRIYNLAESGYIHENPPAKAK